jgi:Protein of unknown function (DUF4435)
MSHLPAPFPPQPPIGHVTVMRASRPDFVGIFVEGPSDASTWRRWLRWEPVVAGGKREVLSAVASLAQVDIPGCVGLIDADYDHLEGVLPPSPDVVVSESHDLECDLVRSPALDALLASVADEASLTRFIGTAGTFRDAIVARALPFGLLRWTFFTRRVPYPDGRLRPFTYIDRSTWTLHQEELLDEAARALGIARTDVDVELAERRARVANVWHACNGHDVVDLLALVLQGPLGQPKAFAKVEAVSMALRLGLDSTHLEALAIWRDLGAWEARRAPYVVRR